MNTKKLSSFIFLIVLPIFPFHVSAATKVTDPVKANTSILLKKNYPIILSLEGGHGLKLETPFFGKKMGFFIAGVLEEDIKEQNLI